MLPEHLTLAVVAAKEAWPDVEIAPDALLAYLGRVAPETITAAEACARLAFSDLFAACACLAHDAQALALFRSRMATWVRAAVSRLQLGSGDQADVESKVAHALLMDEPPKLTLYDGRTELRRWISVIAVRTALNLKRERKREMPLPDSMLLARAEGGDPELAYFRKLYAAEVKAAFSRALDDLPVLDRTMLRSYVLDGLTLQEVGKMYGVHTSTVSRKLAEAEGDLRAGTRKYLAEHLCLERTEADSIVQMVLSLLEQSLRRLLA